MPDEWVAWVRPANDQPVSGHLYLHGADNETSDWRTATRFATVEEALAMAEKFAGPTAACGATRLRELQGNSDS